MNNKKSTKRTLAASVLSLILCMAMLIGTTFAWFTDNATTGVNTIQSGKLDIVLEMKDADGNWVDAEGKTLDFVKAAGAENEAILWEPGCTYKLPALRVRNNGNLALKYQLVINGVNGDAKLLEAIEFTANDAALTTFSGQLLTNNEASDEILIKGHMKEDAGNEYQGLAISGINIAVFATQVEYEHDSYDNQYDVNAPEGSTFVNANGKSYETIAAAMADGAKTIYIAGEHEFTAAQAGSSTDMKGVSIIGVTDDATIVVNGTGGGIANVNLKDLKVVDETVYTSENGENAWEFTYLELEGTSTYTNVAFDDGVLVDGVSSTFTNCSFSGHNNDSSDKGNVTMYGVWIYNGKASFTNCNFSGTRGLKVADQYSGSDVTDVVVDNCFFGPLSEKPGVAVDNRLGSLNLVIKNSTFAGTQAGDAARDPAKGVPCIYENDNTTPDATIIALENNTVADLVSTLTELEESLAAGGDVVLATDIANVDSEKYYGNASALVQMTNGGGVDGNGNTIAAKDEWDDTYDTVVYTEGGTIKNVTIDGAMRGIFSWGLKEDLIIDNVIFNDVIYTLNDDASNGYAIHVSNSTLNGWTSYTSGHSEVTFTNCKFGKGMGYAFLQAHNATTFTNCDFADGFKVNPYNTSAELTFVNCTYNGQSLTEDNIAELLYDASDAYLCTVK